MTDMADDDEREAFLSDKEAELEDEYKSDMTEYESTHEGLIDEARDLVGDTPE